MHVVLMPFSSSSTTTTPTILTTATLRILSSPQRLQRIIDEAIEGGFFANFAVIKGVPAHSDDDATIKPTTIVLRGGEEITDALNAASLSYLGLEREPEVIEAVKSALDIYGTSVTNSRAVCGSCPLHVEVGFL